MLYFVNVGSDKQKQYLSIAEIKYVQAYLIALCKYPNNFKHLFIFSQITQTVEAPLA